jgi:transcriptional regulator with XRE-family HTH domain
MASIQDTVPMSKQLTRATEDAFKEVGESIATWRRIYALKASQVAERAGISLGTLRKIENGDPSIGVSAFLEVLRSLGLLRNLTESLDPMNSDLGRARVTDRLPKRIR